jgi:hypothetical protein
MILLRKIRHVIHISHMRNMNNMTNVTLTNNKQSVPFKLKFPSVWVGRSFPFWERIRRLFASPLLEAVLYRRCRMTRQTLEIINGPSEKDLMLAVFDHFGPDGKIRKLDFVHEYVFRAACPIITERIKVIISGAKIVTDSIYDIVGQIYDNDEVHHFAGRYDCKSRKGTLTLVHGNQDDELEKLKLEAKKSPWFLELIFRMICHLQDGQTEKVYLDFEKAKKLRDAQTRTDLDEAVKQIFE